MLDLPAAIYGVEKILVHYPDICIQTLEIVPPNPKARMVLNSIPDTEIPQELFQLFETTERCSFRWIDPSKKNLTETSIMEVLLYCLPWKLPDNFMNSGNL